MNDISRWHNRHPAVTEPIEAEYSRTANADEVELRDYLKMIVQHRRLLSVVLLAAVSIGAYFSFTATPLYYASAILKIEPQNPSVTGVGEMVRLTEDSGGLLYDYYQTQFKLLESKTLAAKVIAELPPESSRILTNAEVGTANPITRVQSWFSVPLSFVASLISTKKSDAPQEESTNGDVPAISKGSSSGNSRAPIKKLQIDPWLIGRYRQFLDIKPIKNTRLVEIGFSTPDPELSRDLADAHSNGFIRLSLENRFALTKEARDFLDGKNAELKEKLERSEDALNRFRQTHSVVSMEKGENIFVERLVDINRQLTAARAQRIEAESLYKVVQTKSTQSLSQVVNQGMVPSVRSNLLALEAEKVKLSSIFTPDHPRMVELNQQISEMRRSLNTEINNVVRGIQESYFAARSKEQALEADAQKQQQTALNLKHVGVQYAVLEEEVKVNRALYESVLKRLSETNISNDIAVSNMQITQSADKPDRPFTPNIPLNLLVSAVMGFSLGIIVVLVKEYLNSSLNTPQHVWRAVSLTTLGVVPDLSSAKRRLFSFHNISVGKLLPRTLSPTAQQSSTASRELIVSDDSTSLLSDAYRGVRTALLFSQPEKPPKVILLTSPSPAEGKTMTTLNLGIALAKDKHKVLIIDADLRRGCCHTRLGIKNHRGLSNVLTGKLTLEKAIRPTSVHGLSILSRGIHAPNPTDLLGSHQMRQLVSSLRESFNFILIDSPPVIALSDAAILSVMCDGVILVFHGQKTTTACARQAIERLDTVRAPFLGVILNGIDLGHPEYTPYRHYYGSDYASTEKPQNDSDSTGAAAAPEKLDDAEVFFEELGPGTVPQDFFDHMISELSNAAGPMAPLIVRDHIASLGASSAAFPKSRLKELFERVSHEIVDEWSRDDFYRSMRGHLVNL